MMLSHFTAPLQALARGAALSVALALPAAATAATMQAVYTGTVYNTYNATGEFGGAAGDTSGLNGLAFSMTFRYDTDLGGTTDGGYFQQLYGGAAFATASSLVYAAITINGVTQTLDPNSYNLVELYDESSVGGTQTRTYHYASEDFL